MYAVECTLEGTTYKGVANYGARPTFDDKDEFIEVYLEGFSGDMLGKEITVEFTNFIREIQKFENAQALKEQIAADMQNREAVHTAEDSDGQTA